MDSNKDKMKPNKRWCLWKKGNRVGSKGNRLKNKSGWGGAGGRAQRLPPQCVPRKKHIGTSLDGYQQRWNALKERMMLMKKQRNSRWQGEQVVAVVVVVVVHVCFGMFWSQIYVTLTCISTHYFCNAFRTRPKTMPRRGPNKARK